MKQEVYLSQAEFQTPFKFGTLNTIIAPCGSGKTTFISSKLPELYPTDKCVLCLTPFIAAKNQLLSLGFFKADIEELYGMETFLSEHKQIIMTYQQFAWTMKNYANIWDHIGILVLDEVDYLHKIIAMEMGELSKRWGKVVNSETCSRMENRELLIENRPLLVLPHIITEQLYNFCMMTVAISATGLNKIQEMFVDTNVMVPTSNLKSYSHEDREYADLENAIDFLIAYKKPYEKFLIFTKRISKQLEIKKYLESKNLRVATLFSRNNNTYSMTDYDMSILTEIEMEESFLDTDVIVLNESLERAINIVDRRFQHVIINDTNETVVIQVTGRLRFDFQLRLLYNKDSKKSFKIMVEDNSSEIISKFLDIPLFEKEKEELCSSLQWKNAARAPMKWRGVKSKITEEYQVTDRRKTINGKQVRYSVICRKG